MSNWRWSGFIELGTHNQVIGAGDGTPEGAVSGPKGSLWLRTDGGTGSCLYVKETNSGTAGWVPLGASVGSATLAGLTDVNVPTPANGDLLTFDSGSGKWINLPDVDGGGTPASPSTSVQFNNSGSFGGDANLEWDNGNKILKVGPSAPVSLVISGSMPATEKPIQSYGNSYLQRLTVGDKAHYFGDNLEILHVWQQYTDTQASGTFPNALECHSIFQSAAADSPNGAIRGAYITFQSRDSHNIGFGTGLEADATTILGDADNLTAINGSVGPSTTGNATHNAHVGTAIAIDAFASAFVDIRSGAATALVDLAQGVHISGDVSTHATITLYEGLAVDAPSQFIDDAGAGGVITHKIGIHIKNNQSGDATDWTGAGNYAIQVDSGVSSFLGMAANLATKTGTYLVTEHDYTVNCNGTFTVTLPTTGIKINQIFRIKNIGTGVITVACSANIDGSTSASLPAQYNVLRVQWDGAQYWIY